MTVEQRRCFDAMPVEFLPGGTLPPDAPSAQDLALWERHGWILIIDEPKRWALTPKALATWAKEG